MLNSCHIFSDDGIPSMPATTRRQVAIHTVTDPDDAGPSDVEQNLRTALHGVAKLRSRIEHLTRENTQLKEDLDRLYEAQDVSIQPKRGRKGNASILSLTAQVNKLRRQVADLEDARKRDRRKIRKLQLREVKMDAMELGGELVNGIHDESADMKKLLRRFFELVSAPSMEDKEECAKWPRNGAELTKANRRRKQRRRACPLLNMMNEGDLASTDEGAEEATYNDEDAVTASPSRTRVRRLDSSTPPPDGDTSQSLQRREQNSPSTPSHISRSPVSYQSSPLSVKRQRMKELEEARLAKRAKR
ncbi:hypothetical protein ACEPAI_5711 [Sanghuangporus weigelae]